MIEKRNYPKGFTDREGVLEMLKDMCEHTKNFKDDEAIRVKVDFSFRQWSEKKGKFV